MLNVACTNEEKITVIASPVTSTGRPANVDGALRVTIVSGDGSVEQDPATPLQFKAVSGDAQGDTVYTVEADADLGAGEVLITDSVTLSVTSATAASFGLAAGPVEPKA